MTTDLPQQQSVFDHFFNTKPCSLNRLQKYANMTFTCEQLSEYENQIVLLDEYIDFLNTEKKSLPLPRRGENYLIVTIQAINLLTNDVIKCCTPQTCVPGQEAGCEACQKDRRTSNVIKANETFRQKLIHAKRPVTSEHVMVQNNSFNISMRINCANIHQGLEFFTFFVEVVDQDGNAKFRGAFNAKVTHSSKGKVVSNCSIPLVAV